MTSASTKRRHKRNAELVAARKHPIGTRVAVERAPTLAYVLALNAAIQEIQRLRAAMVHAMDDCEQVARDPTTRLHCASRLASVAKRLKAALEKK